MDQLVQGCLIIRDAARVRHQENLPVLLLFDVVDRLLNAIPMIKKTPRRFEVFVQRNHLIIMLRGISPDVSDLFISGRKLTLKVRPNVRRCTSHRPQ